MFPDAVFFIGTAHQYSTSYRLDRMPNERKTHKKPEKGKQNSKMTERHPQPKRPPTPPATNQPFTTYLRPTSYTPVEGQTLDLKVHNDMANWAQGAGWNHDW